MDSSCEPRPTGTHTDVTTTNGDTGGRHLERGGGASVAFKNVTTRVANGLKV